MEFDFSTMAPSQCYKLLVSVVVPRPIALVTSLSREGVVNAAPFSFFNLMGDDPPILILSIERKPDGLAKDTARNIAEQGEFVVNLVDEATAERMHACSRDYPSHESEAAAVGFATLPSRAVAAPRIAESPVAFECVLHEKLETDSRYVFIGRIKWLAARDGLIDTQAWRVNLREYSPIARFGASFYTRTNDRFSLSDAPQEAPSVSTPIDEI